MRSLAASIALLLPIVSTSGCSSHAYHQEALQYVAIAQHVLITKGICATEGDCQSRKLLFFESGGGSLGFVEWGGITVNIYQVQDASVFEDIVAQFKVLHARLDEPKVTVTAYSSRHLEPKVEFRKVVIQ